MLASLRNTVNGIGPWATEKLKERYKIRYSCYTVIVCGPDFSGKTTFFSNLSYHGSIPWVTRNSHRFNHHYRPIHAFDVPGDGVSHRSNGLDALSDCIDPQHGIVFWMHDAANGDVAASIALLHRYVEAIIKLGGRFLIIVLNKQDAILPEIRAAYIRPLVLAFEAHMIRNFGSQIYWQVYDECGGQGFSGKSSSCAMALLNEAESVIETYASFKPQKRVTTMLPPAIEVSTVEEESSNSSLDSDTFWAKLNDGSIALETHVDKLRATYLTVLNAVEKGQEMLELVDEMQHSEERRSMGEFQGHR
jgi:hypothetical protein